MPTLDEIWGWINSYEKKVSTYNGQISRLKEVYKELGTIKSSFRTERNGTEGIFKEKGSWRGETHSAFVRDGSDLDSGLAEYYTTLDSAQDTINRKIADLEAKKVEMVPIINGLYRQYQDLKAEIQNATN